MLSNFLADILAFLWLLVTWHDDTVIMAYGALAPLGVALLKFLITAAISTAISIGISYLTAKDLKGPRQKEQGVQNNDYGAAIPMMWGESVRSGSGTIIWYSGLIEQKRKEGGSGGSTTTFTYRCSFSKLLGEARPDATLNRVWANKKLIYDRGDTKAFLQDPTLLVVKNITLRTGGPEQGPSALMESYLGEGKVPAYRDCMILDVEDLQLADFGPVLPYIEVEISANPQIDAADIISEVSERAGVPVDVSRLDGNLPSVLGYMVDQDIPALDMMVPLAGAYYFKLCERWGQMVCVPNGMRAVANIPAGDLGCVPAGSVPSLPNFERAPEAELPRRVTVTYRSLGRDLQTSSQYAERDQGNAKEDVVIDFPLTLHDNYAKRLAASLLANIIASRRTLDTAWSFRWLDVQPGDVVNIETPVGSYLPFALNRATQGSNGVIEVDLAHEDAEAWENMCETPGGDSTPTTPPVSGPVGKTQLLLIDSPIIRNADDNPGFYKAVVGSRPAWPGAIVFRSADGGTDYEAMGGAVGGAIIGNVDSPTPAGPCEIWDRATVITVKLIGHDHELESKSEKAVLNGANTAWLGPPSGKGGEIFQFVTATLVDTRTYELRGLLRGRRGTEWAVGNHGAGDKFLLLSDTANVIRHDYGAADLDKERLYKAVTGGGTLEDVTAKAFTNGGEGLRPFSPVRLIGRRSADESVSISWMRRTRLMTGGLGGAPAPLAEDAETYELAIYEPADVWVFGAAYVAGNVVREQSAFDYGWRWYEAKIDHTATAANQPDQLSANWANRWTEVQPLRRVNLGDQTTYRWAASDQTAAGITPGDPLMLQVRQQSAQRGFGHPDLARVG